MKKTVSIILASLLCLSLFAGCDKEAADANSSATQKEGEGNVIFPVDETLDIENLENCTVAVAINEGGVVADDNGKMQMTAKVYTYELYDMVDLAELKVGDVITRLGENVTVTALERLDTGIIRINGGEEEGGNLGE